jgi:hypothetical protein
MDLAVVKSLLTEVAITDGAAATRRAGLRFPL